MEDSMGEGDYVNHENNTEEGCEGISSSNVGNGNDVDNENGGVEGEGGSGKKWLLNLDWREINGTTSRWEGLNSQIGRQRELEADFESIVGDPVLSTPLEEIERHAAKVYTRKVFFMFRKVLFRALKLKVLSFMETPGSIVYIVEKRLSDVHVWHVSWVSSNSVVKCTCQRMESIGIPCEHIISILHYLEIPQLPDSVVLTRWTKYAKQCVRGNNGEGSGMSDTMWRNVMVGLLFDCYEMCKVVGSSMEKLNATQKCLGVGDPVRVRTKGCGSRQETSRRKGERKANCCSVCQWPGHNKKTCPERIQKREGSTSGLRDDNHNTNDEMMDV
ncbi:Zinc finger, PMZ-type [Sesbania bispinosa]|nr:Zinc finger, PMZ-type [Sesbania bispinosa]